MQTVPNQAIFSVQAGVCNLFREFLTSQGFAEIHTPKIISGLKENFSSKECCAQKGALLEKNGCLVCWRNNESWEKNVIFMQNLFSF